MHQNNSNQTLRYFIILVIIIDLIASYFCFLQTPLLGDLANMVLPSEEYAPVLSDPLGFKMLSSGETHTGPNRFFLHWFSYLYFNHFPFFLQNFIHPVDSVYVSCAIHKLFTHIGITYILTSWVTPRIPFFHERFLFIFALLGSLSLASPYGFLFPMRVIDQSIIYTFAYAFSLLALLAYMHPFVKMYCQTRPLEFKWWEHLLLITLSFVVIFNGPINAPTAILISSLALLGLWWHNFKQQPGYGVTHFVKAISLIPRPILFHFGWIILLGLYSFYLGTFNTENPIALPSVLERFDLLAAGIFKILFLVKTTPLTIVILTTIALYFLHRYHPSDALKKLLTIAKCIIIFILIYTVLLPFGGYRGYRNLIIRFDTMLPITFGLFILLGATANLLLQSLSKSSAQKLKTAILAVVTLVTIIDSLSLYPVRNSCERSTLFQLSEATEEPVLIPDCSILSWEPIPPHQYISPQSKMLHRWNITQKPLIYYHPN